MPVAFVRNGINESKILKGEVLRCVPLKNPDANFSFVSIIILPLTSGSRFLFGATTSYKRNVFWIQTWKENNAVF